MSNRTWSAWMTVTRWIGWWSSRRVVRIRANPFSREAKHPISILEEYHHAILKWHRANFAPTAINWFLRVLLTIIVRKPRKIIEVEIRNLISSFKIITCMFRSTILSMIEQISKHFKYRIHRIRIWPWHLIWTRLFLLVFLRRISQLCRILDINRHKLCRSLRAKKTKAFQ